MKVKQIKEIIDKLKNMYKMEMEYKKYLNEHLCYFKMNSQIISEGKGQNKKYAKNDAAAKAYDILIQSDYNFAKKAGIKFGNPDEDFRQNLIDYGKRKDINVVIDEGQENELKYSKFQITYDSKLYLGFGSKTKKCINFMCYNILNSIIKEDELKLEQMKEVVNQSQETFQKKFTIVLQKKKQESIIPETIKQSPSNFDKIIKELQIQHFLNSLLIQDDVYHQFKLFLDQLNQQNDFDYHTVGSYTTKSIRSLKPELDILINIPKGNFPLFEQYLEKIARIFQSKVSRNKKIIHIDIPFQSKSKVLKSSFQSLKVILYIKKKLTQETLIHDDYMKQYQIEYLKNRYSTQYFSLIHQWKEDSQIRLSSKILDFLIVQISNYLKSSNPPIQVLKQLIFLLKNGILDDLIELEKNEIELNPFLQAIPEYQVQLIKKISETNRKEIQDKAKFYDEQKIQEWISNYI